mgnify:CR=1 FL=1
MVEFIDLNNEMLSTNSLKDGSIVKLYIGGQGDEKYYKPIRQDFMITDIKKVQSGVQNMGDFMQYRITGSLNVPVGHRKESWCNQLTTSISELFNLAVYTGLGFATNFPKQTNDKMGWLNPLGTTYFDFMREIAGHACYSPFTFFTAFVDQYYVLNFIECHSLLSHGGKKKDTPAMIYSNIQDSNVSRGEDGKTINLNKVRDEDKTFEQTQAISYYFITNHEFFAGWSNFIEEYVEISEGQSSMNDGYRKHVSYTDMRSDGGGDIDFTITPIDNIMRNKNGSICEEYFPQEPDTNTYIPLNLMQMNDPGYIDDKVNSDINKMSHVESHVSFGFVDTTNMFPNYYYARVQNDYQMRMLKKCGIRVTLQNYNPAITRFSRIWVDLYDKNTMSSQIIHPDAHQKNEYTNSLYDEILAQNDENSLVSKFKDEGVVEGILGKENDVSKDTKFNVIDKMIDDKKYLSRGENNNIPRGRFNRGLSGWYVVTEMKIIYTKHNHNLQTCLVLNRIEHKPLFKSEYNIAKKSVGVYNEDLLKYKFKVTSTYVEPDAGIADAESGTMGENTTTQSETTDNTTTQK